MEIVGKEEKASFELDNTPKAALALQMAFVKEHVALLERLIKEHGEGTTPQQLKRVYVEALVVRLTHLDILLHAREQTAQQMNRERRFVGELSVLSEMTQLERLRTMLDRERETLTLQTWRPALYKRLGITKRDEPVSSLAHPPQRLSIVMPDTASDASMEAVENGMASFCQFHALRLLALYNQKKQLDERGLIEAMECGVAVLQQQLAEMPSEEGRSSRSGATAIVLSEEHCDAVYKHRGWTQDRVRRLHKTLTLMKKLFKTGVSSGDNLSLNAARELLMLALDVDEDVAFFRPLWQRLVPFMELLLQQREEVALRLRCREIVTTFDLLFRTFENNAAQIAVHNGTGGAVRESTLAEELSVFGERPQRFDYKILAELDKQLEMLLADWARNLVQQENVGFRIAHLLASLDVTLDSRDIIAQYVTRYFQTHEGRPEKHAIRNIILQHTEFY